LWPWLSNISVLWTFWWKKKAATLSQPVSIITKFTWRLLTMGNNVMPSGTHILEILDWSTVSIYCCTFSVRLYYICKIQYQLVAKHFYLLINAPTCFGLKCLAIFREFSLACTALVPTCILTILHTIKIIMVIKCCSS